MKKLLLIVSIITLAHNSMYSMLTLPAHRAISIDKRLQSLEEKYQNCKMSEWPSAEKKRKHDEIVQETSAIIRVMALKIGDVPPSVETVYDEVQRSNSSAKPAKVSSIAAQECLIQAQGLLPVYRNHEHLSHFVRPDDLPTVQQALQQEAQKKSLRTLPQASIVRSQAEQVTSGRVILSVESESRVPLHEMPAMDLSQFYS